MAKRYSSDQNHRHDQSPDRHLTSAQTMTAKYLHSQARTHANLPVLDRNQPLAHARGGGHDRAVVPRSRSPRRHNLEGERHQNRLDGRGASVKRSSSPHRLGPELEVYERRGQGESQGRGRSHSRELDTKRIRVLPLSPTRHRLDTADHDREHETCDSEPNRSKQRKFDGHSDRNRDWERARNGDPFHLSTPLLPPSPQAALPQLQYAPSPQHPVYVVPTGPGGTGAYAPSASDGGGFAPQMNQVQASSLTPRLVRLSQALLLSQQPVRL
jgi:hypothetical protein